MFTRPLIDVLLNDNIASHQGQRGIARYFNHITGAVAAHFGEKGALYSPETPSDELLHYLPAPHFTGRWSSLRRDLAASWVTRRIKPKVLFNAYYGRARTSGASVCTVYDMIFEKMPQYFERNSWTLDQIAMKRFQIERATTLLCISHSTAQDVLTIYPNTDPNKLVVTHLGVDEFFFRRDNTNSPYGQSQKPFFLFVGNRSVYKNFLRLLEAFGKSSLHREFDLRVISPSTHGWSREEQELIDRHKLSSSVHLLQEVSDVTLQASYSQSIALVYPSEFEGFGLPVAEAMASGTLVITSQVSSMPEVGGEAAFYCEPHQVDSILICLEQVANLSCEERARRVEASVAQASRFSWARCGVETLDAINRLL
jgi:glycosyltransferase involved in cell wall biosynthesis